MRPTTVHPTTEPPSTAPAAATTQPASQPAGFPGKADDPKIAAFAGLVGPKPATWIAHPPTRQFAVAEYAVPGRDGADQAHITVSVVGGTVEMNMARWKTQWRTADKSSVDPKVTKLEANGMPITLVEFAGEYSGMTGGIFTRDQLMLMAVVEPPDSANKVFIRFVGPTATVETNREPYMTMLNNLKQSEAQK